MTQKELLYMEDAISHEKAIMAILKESITKCNDEIGSFFNNEINKHQKICDSLMNKLKENVNG